VDKAEHGELAIRHMERLLRPLSTDELGSHEGGTIAEELYTHKTTSLAKTTEHAVLNRMRRPQKRLWEIFKRRGLFWNKQCSQTFAPVG
jgi:hypothetical protein